MSYKENKLVEKNLKPRKGFNEYSTIGANNFLSAEETFEKRNFYKNFAFQTDYLEDTKQINFWKFGGNLYGRVDMNGDPIYVDEHYLKQYSAKKTVFGLAFVVDAYNDMMEYVSRYKLQAGARGLKKENIFFSPEVKKGWVSLSNEYSNYLQNLSSAFNEFYLTPQRQKKILNLESFVRIFVEFVRSITRQLPVTLSAFTRSKHCNPRISGLIVDVHNLDYSDDTIKSGFLSDIDINFYVKTAEQFGFLVDKNAPWRLVANMTLNKKIAQKMSKYGVPYSYEKMNKPFKRFYKSAYDVEISILRHYMVELYNNYVLKRPTMAVADPCKKWSTYSFEKITKIKTITRKPEDCFFKGQLDLASNYAQQYGELFWLRVYYYLRMVEERKLIDDYEMNKKFRNDIIPYYKVHGLSKTIKGINRELNVNVKTF